MNELLSSFMFFYYLVAMLWFSSLFLWLKVRTPKKSQKQDLSNLEVGDLSNLEVEDLPDDVFLKIFSSLPVKSIGPCMCVSKRWCSLLKNPSFVSSYNNNIKSERNQYFICWKNERQLELYNRMLDSCKGYTVPIDNIYNFWDESSMAICNGVILLATQSNRMEFVLWNPTIRKLLPLPQPNVKRDRPAVYIQHLGFAFDSLANDYKVVRILEYGKGMHSDVQTFSINRNSWKFACQIDHKYSFGNQPHSTLNGAIHWIAKEERCMNSVIFCFDVNADSFRHIKFPNILEYEGMQKKLAIYKGSSLALVTMAFEDTHFIHVWLMKEYGNVGSWTNIWEFDGYRWPGLYFLTIDCPKHMADEKYRIALLRNSPRWIKQSITEVTNEVDLETVIIKKLVIGHVFRPIEESLVLLGNDKALNV